MYHNVIKGLLCGFAMVAAGAISCQADVISADWKNPRDGLLTRDLDNGLEWLDFSETMILGSPNSNRTFDDVSSQFGIGGEFEGFRHATEAEIIALWTSAGIPDINAGGTTANYAPVDHLVNLMGLTSEATAVIPFSAGIYGESAVAGTHLTAMLEVFPPATNPPGLGRARTSLQSIADDESTLVGGHFLVRATSVPEPGSLGWLSALGLFGTVSVRFRTNGRRLSAASRASRRRND